MAHLSLPVAAKSSSSSSSSPSSFLHVHHHARPYSKRVLSYLTLLLCLVSTLSLSQVSAQQQPKSITLTFRDASGAQVGQPQTVGPSSCIVLLPPSAPVSPTPSQPEPTSLSPSPSPSPSQETSLPVPSPSPSPSPVSDPSPSPLPSPALVNKRAVSLAATAAGYVSVTASHDHAALNLYQDSFCQVLIRSAVGHWNNTDPVANIVAIRWEGTAPSTDAPGTLSPNAFPPGMAVQTKVPAATDGDRFMMDPSKGKIVVGLVAAVLAVGVMIGVYQVYQAAQYVPPPKKAAGPRNEKPERRLIGEKKVKRRDAYFKKPVKTMTDEAQLLTNSGVGEGDSGGRQGVNNSRSQGHEGLAGNKGSDYNASNFAGVGTGGNTQHDSVLIDMQESSTFGQPWLHSSNSSNRNSSTFQGSYSRASSATATDLAQYGMNNNNNTYDNYQANSPYNTNTTPLSTTATSAATSGSDGGRPGEVLVPMHDLARRTSSTRRTGRSP
ncbi:hypothetical protein EDD11_004546 [Mortierella claussenii]|nr:hypothetical protein EDD11_004546 [Mortierella claussenii]